MLSSIDKLAQRLIAEGVLREETYLEVRNLDPVIFTGGYVVSLSLRRFLRHGR
jgi:hypothetical protein